MTDTLLTARQGACLTLTLNRPQSRNALSRVLIAGLTEQLNSAAQDDAIRCVVLSGAGQAFCAGLDLKEVAGCDAELAQRDADALVALFERLDTFPKPLIAAVNGPAVAGGAGIVSVCDIVLCADGAVIGYPEIKRGLVAALVMCYLRRLVGERRAKFLLLTGESLTARQALEFGLVTEVVAAADLHTRAHHYAEMLAGYAPGPLAATKRLWATIRPLQHADAIAEARALNAAMRTSADAQRGAAGFLNE